MLTRTDIIRLAWPIMLSQMAIATTGLVDTFVMAKLGVAEQLGGVALGTISMSFLYWGFGFLRMTTTALTAQAKGAKDDAEVSNTLMRALALAGCIGLVLMMVFPLFQMLALYLSSADPNVESSASGLMLGRIGGAPAAMVGFVINGWLLGTGQTRKLLVFQIIINTVNIALDVALVRAGWGASGIGAGTAMAEWTSVVLGLWLVKDGLRLPGGWRGLSSGWSSLLATNSDVMIRTLALLASFAWFTNAGGRLGAGAIAGNQVLLQFIALAAFVQDAFAFVAEKETGESIGASDPGRLRQALWRTTELSLVMGLVFSVLFYGAGGWVINTMITDPVTRDQALTFLPYCALVPLIGMPAWQLDGVFLGATQSKALRNAALLSTVVYIAVDLLLRPMGNTGLWLAFLIGYIIRGLSLGLQLPRLIKQAENTSKTAL